MKKTMLGKLLLSGTMLTSVLFGFTSASSAADPVVVSGNPIITSIFTADPSAHVWSDGRIYLYPSHDIFPSRGSDLMDKYHVYSSDNMVDWVDEGEILSADDVPWGRPEGGFMWAPDAAYKNGTYYFYFPHPSDTNWNSSWKIGVATSSQPDSGFTVQGYIPGLPGSNMIDPNVFRDDDGTYYLYAGGGGVSYGAKLGSDMMSIDGPIAQFTELQDYHEAPWVFKKDGLYYMTYADGNPGANRMRYATSANPLGPWTNRGILLDPVAGSETTHGSVVAYKGNWYLFYHTAKVSNNGTLRNTSVDRLYFNADGTIQKVVQTEDGVPAVGPRSTATEVKYYDIVNANDSEYTQKTDYAMTAGNVTFGGGATRPGSTIENLHLSGAYIQLGGINGGASGGKALLTVEYASADGGPAFKVDASGDPYGDGYYLGMSNTGGWGNYTGVAKRLIDLNPGTNNVVKLTGGMGGVNVSKVSISLKSYVPQSVTEYPVTGSNVTVGGGATKNGSSIENMHLSGAYFQVSGVNGGTGGNAQVTVVYGSADALSTFGMAIGGNAYSLTLPGTGGWSTYTGSVSKQVVLAAGTNNVIRFNGGAGGANVTKVIVTINP
ncbi:family 43 glycosylhydrolase [Cohnella ginsengisoli]|uniref:Family 43 glycosylhydrolase n=1 Tax=Cohnella ginsengisoli TaxID=425004 RepID=A0A9X4KG09_9BACL|nr:family 43 glycosylhydrolase [Cohnella ginsengisoli]MDG0791290.1 family 43 glycosylhydrolase [Cohnella ginsengisoli]